MAKVLPADIEPAAATTIATPSSSVPIRVRADAGHRVQTILALFDQAVVSGGNFVTTVIVARYAGLNGLGVYSLGITLAIFLSAIQESLIVLPYTIYANRLTGLKRAHCAGAALVQQLVLAMLATALLGTLAAALTISWNSPFSNQLAILAVCAPFVLLREFGRRVWFADLRIIDVLILDSIVTFLLFSGLLTLAWREQLTAITALLCLGGVSALGGIGWIIAVRKQLAFSRDSILTEFHRNARLGGWACLSRISNVAESYTVHWLLAIMLGTVATGAFAACMTVVNLSNPFLLGAGAILVPYAARAFAQDGRKGLLSLMTRANRWLIPPTAIFVVLMFLFGGPILEVIYKDAFAGPSALVGFLALSVLASTCGMAADNALRAMEKTRINFVASLCGLATSTLITLLTVSQLGPLGAAIGLACGGSVATAYRVIAARRLLIGGEC